MPKLIYSAIASLDGYIEDASGGFGWARPDEAVHRFVNDLERPVGTYLYGRRMYETMAGWETDPAIAEPSRYMRDYAKIWKSADKIVFSHTLERVVTEKTRIERHFDPERVRELKRSAARDLSIGGPELAAHALRAGLVDELHLFTAPVVVGGGKRWLPHGVRFGLRLLDQRRFADGMVYHQYVTAP